MLAPKLFMLASSFALTLLTTGLFVIQPQTSSQDVDDDLPGRVEVLETQVAYLSTRVAALEAETPEPTQTPQDEAEAGSQEDPEKGAGLGKSSAENEADTALADEYEPILADIDAFPCEYDAFMDQDDCNFLNMSDQPDLWNYQGGTDSVYTLLTVFVAQETGRDPEMAWILGYQGDDWLFLEGAIFVYDEQRYSIEVEYGHRSTDTMTGGGVLELADVPFEDIDRLIDIVTADNVEVRLLGDQDRIDIPLTDLDKELLLQALATYEQRGGHLPDNKDKLLTLIPSE